MDLNGHHLTSNNRISIVTQIKSQSAIKIIFGLFTLKCIKELLIWLVISRYIFFIVIENQVFQTLLNIFFLELAP